MSAELEKAQPGPTPKDTSHRREVTHKSAVLKAAGISTSAANRAEKLAAHAEAVEAYIAKKAAQGKPVVITEALTAVQAAAREQKAADALRKSFERSKMRSQPRI